jgi:regulator of sigma E protease
VSGQGAAAAENIAGPVGIVVLFSEIGQAGIGPLMVFIGLLSVALAVFNILPIPALDGGRLFVTALFRALKKPLSQQKEEQIQAVGMTVLMLLVIVITVLDVRRFF